MFEASNLLNIGIKIAGFFVTFMYILYSLVIIRQVQAMKKVIEIADRGLLLMTAYVQLSIAIILFFYSLLIL